MRKIIFRGKRLDDGEWVEGSLIVWSDGSCSIETGRLAETMLSVDPDTVGQYTGLMANGKRIWEGDIVNGLFLFERPIAGVVTFRDGSFGVQWMRGKVEEFSAFTSCCNVAWEVVGNVADNPELLEGGANDG